MGVQRSGMVIGVRDLLENANTRNFSTFLARLPDGKPYLLMQVPFPGESGWKIMEQAYYNE